MAMRKPIEIWQAVIGTIALLLTVGTIIIQQSNRITTQQERINYLIESKVASEVQFHEVNINLKEMNSKLTDILIELQNKQDRSKN